MRILVLADRLTGGGLETHIIATSNELMRRGHQIFLYTAYTDPNVASQFRTEMGRFYTRNWSNRPLNDVGWFRPDVVHSHPFTAIFKGYELVTAMQRPFFITMHGLYDFGIDRSPLGNRVSDAAHTIIAVDQRVLNLLKGCTAHPEKLTVIYNGIDFTTYKPLAAGLTMRQKYGLNPNWPTLTVISRLADGKERPVEQLLHCAVPIAERLYGLNILIVGDGPGFSRLSQMTERMRHPQIQLRFVGFQKDVRTFLAVADLVLACDRAALEAMACQRAVFAMNSEGFAGLATPANFGRIFLHRQGFQKIPDQLLIYQLAAVLQSIKPLSRIASQCRELTREYFDIEMKVSQLERLYAATAG